MLKSLIWGADAPVLGEESQPDSAADQQHHQHRLQEQEEEPILKQDLQPSSLSLDTPVRFRGHYDLARSRRGGGARGGPLSVNDPQLEATDFATKLLRSENFLSLACPIGAGNSWRIQYRDATVHVHLLLRAMVAAQDFAGAARALATLHRLHCRFDPDIYRYTVSLLRLSGDHQRTTIYFRKIMGVKVRTIGQHALSGRAIAHDFLAYLSDMQEFAEALSVGQGLLQTSAFGTGQIRKDPSLKAHVAVLRLFAALLEHRNAPGSEEGDAGPLSSPRIPDLQDPLSLIARLRTCRSECATGGPDTCGAKARALDHLAEAKKLAKQAAKQLPSSASVAGYRAALKAAESGTIDALRQMERFVGRNPGSVKGRALHARLLEMNVRDARARCRAKQDTQDQGHEDKEAIEAGEGLHLVGVARACALRSWLETDPLEPRAALGLAALHLEQSGDIVGVADKALVAKALVDQLETHGFARNVSPSTAAEGCGSLHTTRAAVELWRALADLLGPLRVRDEPVPLPLAAERRAVPPRPGTIWDHLYGGNPPWAPTDFQQGKNDYQRNDGGASKALGGTGNNGLPGPPVPHPLLWGVDRELWADMLLDPNADPLLAVNSSAAGQDAAGDGEMWCSDDEDCVMDDESEALQAQADLASKRSGGCMYYSPPGEEEGLARWGGATRMHKPGTATGEARQQDVRDASPQDVDAGASGTSARAGAGVQKEEFVQVQLEGLDSARGQNDRASKRAAGAAFKAEEVQSEGGEPAVHGVLLPDDWGEQDFKVECQGIEEVDTRAKRRRQEGPEEEEEEEGEETASDAGSKRRRLFFALGEDNVDIDLAGEGERTEGDYSLGEGGGGGTGDTAYVAPGLHEAKAPLGPPVGADAEATRLSETISFKLPDEAAVWLLVNKCCAAAHVFGPQHSYCLEAIGRLCRDDVRDIARPARDSLRSRGFRLQLSLARLAAHGARAAAAMEGSTAVAWKLPSGSSGKAFPLDGYVPEVMYP